MPCDFLHDHPQFADLVRIVAEEKGIDPALERLIELALTRAMLGRLGLGPARTQGAIGTGAVNDLLTNPAYLAVTFRLTADCLPVRSRRTVDAH